MTRIHFIFCVLILLACNARTQRQRTSELAESLFDQGSREMQEGLRSSLSDSAAMEHHYRLALKYMNQAISLDSTNLEYRSYHEDLYAGLGEYDSAIMAASKNIGPQTVKIDSFSLSRRNGKIATWYFRVGDTINGQIQSLSSLRIDPSWRAAFAENLFEVSNEVYRSPFRRMKSIESSCLVSLSILEFSRALMVSSKESDNKKYQIAVKDRRFNCSQQGFGASRGVLASPVK